MPEIVIDTRSLFKLSKAMHDFPEVAKQAMPSVINRTLSTVNTKVQKEITQKYKIKKSDLGGGNKYKSEASNNLIKIKKASRGSLQGKITVRGSTLTLYRFIQTPKEPISHKGKTMKAIKKLKFPKVQVKKGGIKSVNRTFVLKAKGALGIFTRDNNGTLRMLRTLSVAQMAGNEQIMNTAQNIAIDTLNRRIEHELEYRLNRIAGELG